MVDSVGNYISVLDTTIEKLSKCNSSILFHERTSISWLQCHIKRLACCLALWWRFDFEFPGPSDLQIPSVREVMVRLKWGTEYSRVKPEHYSLMLSSVTGDQFYGWQRLMFHVQTKHLTNRLSHVWFAYMHSIAVQIPLLPLYWGLGRSRRSKVLFV